MEYTSFKNRLKVLTADILIKPIHYSSRVYEKITGRFHGLRNHYYIMNIFRSLGGQYMIDTSYPNPLVTHRRLKWRLDLCQNTQQWIYRSKGRYEIEWIRMIDEALDEAQCFLDVGAHVGVFTLTLAQARPDKKIVAVEGLPINVRLLKQNIQSNHLQNVQVLEGVVSNTKGKVPFYINPINEGGGSLLPLVEYKTGGIALDAKQYQKRRPNFLPCLEVDSHRLDDLVQEKSLLKIDVEGSEMSVLKSGDQAFNKGLVDMAVVEVGEGTAIDALKWFHGKGFDCFTLGDKSPVKVDGNLGSRISCMGRMYICLRRGSTIYFKVRLA